MKIFNWVQRKFNHGSLKDETAKDVIRAELVITTEANKQALSLVDVLEGWKDGILTIGTLGLDPILDFSTKQKGYFILGSETAKNQDQVQELEFSSSAVYENSGSHTDPVDDDRHRITVRSDEPTSDDDDDEGERDPLIVVSSSGAKKPAVPAVIGGVGDGVGSDNVDLEVEIKPSCVAEICEERKARGERVTLAELFQAESGKKNEHVGGGVDQPAGNKPAAALRSRNGLSFPKKLKPHNQEKAQPIKNLNKFMRKILKKKIHPELEGKYSKISNDTQNKPGKVDAHHLHEETNTGDSKFLLPSTPQG